MGIPESQLSVFVDDAEHKKFNSNIYELKSKDTRIDKKYVTLFLLKKFNNDKKIREECLEGLKGNE